MAPYPRQSGDWRSRGHQLLGFEKDKVLGLGLKGAIEGHHCQTGSLRESREIGVGPVLRGGLRRPSQRAKLGIESARLIEEVHSLIAEPTIVRIPRVLLAFCVVRTHHRRRAQETKKPKLGQAAEEEMRRGSKTREPLTRHDVVDMPVVRQRNPNVDVREKR